MRIWRTLFALAFGGWVLFLSPKHARADDAAQARFHDQRARSLYQQARFEDALREFFIVRRLAPEAETSFNIALCFDQMGQAEQAFYYFNQFLQGSDREDPRARFARAALTRLGEGIAQLEVSSEPPGAQVYVDRTEYGSWGSTPVIIPMSAGPHALWVVKPGYRRTKVEVTARLGEQPAIHIDLVPIRAQLRLTSDPPAELILSKPDGELVAQGQTPFKGEVIPGVYVAELQADGFRPERIVLTAAEGRPTERALTLEALPAPKGSLTITSNVRDALVEVDGQPEGFAPVLLSDVDLGLRQIRVSSDSSLVPWEGSVEVRQQGQGYITATLQPPARTERSPMTWVTGGIGASALTAALVSGILAMERSNELQRCRGTPQRPECPTDLNRLRSEGQTFAVVSDALWITGGISMVTAGILYFVTARKTALTEADVSWKRR